MPSALLYFLLAFGAVWLLERQAHRRLQQVFLLLTGHIDAATLLYSFVLLPGVALHELSHAFVALLLGVKVRGFSLRMKRLPAGIIRLGYVEILRTDTLRTSLIGAAPLLAGIAALLIVGDQVFELHRITTALATFNASAITAQMLSIFSAKDAFFWIYVVFTIANGMMPSPSDTRAWPPVAAGCGAISGALTLLVYAIGGAPLLNQITATAAAGDALRWLGSVLTLTAFINAAVILMLSIVAVLLRRVTGRRTVFRR